VNFDGMKFAFGLTKN